MQASIGMSYGPFRRKYLVGPDDMEQLVEEYKGRLTENSRLTKAARLAAKQHVLLTSGLPPATKKTRVKSLTGDLHRATKRIQQMQTGPGVPAVGEEEPDLAQGPLDTFLKSLIKSLTPKPVKGPSTGTQATPLARPPPTKQQIATTVPLPDDDEGWDQPSTSTGKGKGKSLKGTLSSAVKKKLLAKGKEAVKRKLQREVKGLKLPPGWDPWGTKVKRILEDDF